MGFGLAKYKRITLGTAVTGERKFTELIGGEHIHSGLVKQHIGFHFCNKSRQRLH